MAVPIPNVVSDRSQAFGLEERLDFRSDCTNWGDFNGISCCMAQGRADVRNATPIEAPRGIVHENPSHRPLPRSLAHGGKPFFWLDPGGSARTTNRLESFLPLPLRLLPPQLSKATGELQSPVLPVSKLPANPGLQRQLAQLLPQRAPLPLGESLHLGRVLSLSRLKCMV